MGKRFSLILVSLFAFTAFSNAASWEIDITHSSVGFSVRHLVITKIKGFFKEFSGTVEFDGKNLSSGLVEFSVQVASIDTDNKDRDDHLRSPDFFDAEKKPTMTFKSKKVHDIDGNNFKITGDLAIKGVTREVTFDCEFYGIANDPMGNTKAGFSATTTINRQDFKVSWNKTLDTGGLIVGNEVTISMELEMAKAS